MDIIGKKYWYFLISALIIVPGLVSVMLFGLKLSIDYTGGSVLEIQFPERNASSSQAQEIKQAVEKQNVEVATITPAGTNQYVLRLKPIDNQKKEEIKQALGKEFGTVKEVEFTTVGPTVSGALSWKTFLSPLLLLLTPFGARVSDDNMTKAFISVFWASVGILIYIAYSFRKVPKPASSWKFGTAAIVALLHDVLLVVGLFSIFGKLWNVEIDALFITALLTVMGFSVHDTIVVFDRIRENLEKQQNHSFAELVNLSIVQTLGRSLMTSLTVVFVLLALLLFGGVSIRWFVAALLAGIISGTYSSIFNAAPLLVVWQDWQTKKAYTKR